MYLFEDLMKCNKNAEDDFLCDGIKMRDFDFFCPGNGFGNRIGFYWIVVCSLLLKLIDLEVKCLHVDFIFIEHLFDGSFRLI